MAAAKYTGTAYFVCQDGHRFNHYFTASDVNTEFWLIDGDTTLTEWALPAIHGVVTLYDIILGSNATDCRGVNLYVNGKDAMIKIRTTLNLLSVVTRQLAGCPIRFEPGAKLQFKQATLAT